MASTDKVFAGPIPEIYDRILVPLLFETYATDLAERVADARPQRILEIAAGTGAVTRAIAARLDATGRIVASDLNQPMLDRAAARQGADARITWRQADAMDLPFNDQGFDVVVCQFGAMFFPDKLQAYQEVYRVLRPGGHYLFNVWDQISENDFPRVVTDALVGVFPHDPPRFMERTPHGYHDLDMIRRDLATAGFDAISIETLGRMSRAGSAQEVAVAYCQGTPLRTEIEARAPPNLEAVTQSVAEALARSFGHGAIEGKIRAHVVSAKRR
ncbi:class I SAM-dependent methyltransferase [Bosea sp. PAMC 26642]|uniref:class I SAM-dependent methyltransferase n=1 Tax=Bosea sp. (strain PAMC 26642) TaxID=1792307 RepID=UPI00077009E3|nr:methyltransferase domain-containing protein [Bosea sp. PAMC 26642]AMJ59580.1 SAM-dependent methyltransferase [Bosea sp. PAMC 26642]